MHSQYSIALADKVRNPVPNKAFSPNEDPVVKIAI